MDILTVLVIFLILEVAICGLCWYVCRERHVSSGKTEKASKKPSHHSAPHSPRLVPGVDHQKTWSRAVDQQLEGTRQQHPFDLFPSKHPSLRHCE